MFIALVISVLCILTMQESEEVSSQVDASRDSYLYFYCNPRVLIRSYASFIPTWNIHICFAAADVMLHD